ncbi:MAG: SDR family oxidoreductase [Bacteroidaceae bacterium]|nr:SDR family oxidoreductase [Bacteroidaceae bacterium]
MTKIKDCCVLVTGGASGIGKIMGRIALERGARCLVIWDINEASINAVKEEYKNLGRVVGYKVDVSDSKQVEKVASLTGKECGNVDILINNAGIVANNNTFDKQSTSDIERTISINTVAPMIIANQFLPGMIKRNKGHICNIASAAGMLSNPRMAVYAASKWGVIGWSDSVRIELKQMKSKVRFTTIAPYFINTGMFDGVKSRIFPILKPEPTSRKIMNAIEGNRNFKGIPFGFHFIRFCQALLPTTIFDYIFGEVVGIFHAMDNFTGRKK